MKTTFALLVGVISLSCATLTHAQAAGGTAEKAVAALEDRWTQSERTNNPDRLAQTRPRH
jgi:hypothetical protein